MLPPRSTNNTVPKFEINYVSQTGSFGPGHLCLGQVVTKVTQFQLCSQPITEVLSRALTFLPESSNLVFFLSHQANAKMVPST